MTYNNYRINRVILLWSFTFSFLLGCIEIGTRYEVKVIEDIDTIEVYNSTFHCYEERYDLWYEGDNKVRVNKSHAIGDTLEFYRIYNR